MYNIVPCATGESISKFTHAAPVLWPINVTEPKLKLKTFQSYISDRPNASQHMQTHIYAHISVWRDNTRSIVNIIC